MQRTEVPIVTNLRPSLDKFGVQFDLTAKSIKAICEVEFNDPLDGKSKLIVKEYQDACTGGGKFLECVEPEEGDTRGRAWKVEGKKWLVADTVMKLHLESLSLFCDQNNLLLWAY